MDITRRVFVSVAMAAYFLGKVGAADAAAMTTSNSGLYPTFAILDGFTELRLTNHALTQLGTIGVTPYALAPAEAITGPDGMSIVGVKLPAEQGRLSVDVTGRPVMSMLRLLGGIGLRNGKASMEIVDLRGNAADGLVFAFLKKNETWQGELSVYWLNVDDVRLITEVGLPNNTTEIKGSAIPLRAAQEGLDVFASTFGSSLFTADDVAATSRFEVSCWPLPPS
jgi:hypothetical protein